ncbi:MAG: cytochrome b/b6 domain-containing protein [Mucilaginibacter sp.]
MTVIEPKRRDLNSHHIKKNSASLRLWHWLNTLVITGSLLTVLLNSTVLKSRNNAPLIQKQLTDAGVTVTTDQARSAAHAISDKIWTVHIYFGYTLAALLLFRLIMELFQLADQKLIRKIKSAYKQYFIVKKQRETALHEFWVKALYAAFYLMLLVMVLTGLSLAFEDDVPLLKSMHWIREVHSFTMYLILAFIVVHLAGVFLAERKDSPGIISDMVNGGKHEV